MKTGEKKPIPQIKQKNNSTTTNSKAWSLPTLGSKTDRTAWSTNESFISRLLLVPKDCFSHTSSTEECCSSPVQDFRKQQHSPLHDALRKTQWCQCSCCRSPWHPNQQPSFTSQDLASSPLEEDEQHSEADEPLSEKPVSEGPLSPAEETLPHMDKYWSHKNLNKPQYGFELNKIKFEAKEAKNKKMKASEQKHQAANEGPELSSEVNELNQISSHKALTLTHDNVVTKDVLHGMDKAQESQRLPSAEKIKEQ
ncbi:Methylcytosine dioxygenase TET1, partial [Plecturocebus cupreus]